MEKRSYGDIMSEVFQSPLVEKFQTRVRRRSLVISMGLWMAGITALCLLLPQAWWLWGPLFLLFFPLASMINMSVRGVTEIPISHLDDRLAQLRARAFHDAYYIGVVLALIGGIVLQEYLFATVGESRPLLSIVPIGGMLGGFLFGLPAVMLAWRLPDEPEHEEAAHG